MKSLHKKLQFCAGFLFVRFYFSFFASALKSRTNDTTVTIADTTVQRSIKLSYSERAQSTASDETRFALLRSAARLFPLSPAICVFQRLVLYLVEQGEWSPYDSFNARKICAPCAY